MILLAFDTAQGALSAAVRDGKEELASLFEERTRGHAEALMPMVETVLAEAALGFADLDALAVTVGPGTFTGLRVGLAAARGIALSRGLPLVGVTTLEAIAEPVAAEADEIVLASFDARRDEVYMQAFSADGPERTAPLLVALGDVLSRLPLGPLVLSGTGTPLMTDILSAGGRPFRTSATRPQPDASAVARMAVRRLGERGAQAFLTPPAPLYIRAPDAKLPGGRDPGEAA